MGHPEIEKLKVKELDFYLNEHGLTTIDRNLDKVKEIRWTQTNRVVLKTGKVTYFPQCGGRERQLMTLFSTICLRRVTLHRQFSSYQMTKVVVQGSWDVSINIHVTCLHIVTLAFCGGWDRRGGIMKSSTANVGGSKPHCMLSGGDLVSAPLLQQKSFAPPFPQAINYDRSLRTTETRFYEHVRLAPHPNPYVFLNPLDAKTWLRSLLLNLFRLFFLLKRVKFSAIFSGAKKFNLPCGTKFLREFIFLRIGDFCVLRELIFAIRTDWFFLLGINLFTQ